MLQSGVFTDPEINTAMATELKEIPTELEEIQE